MSFYFDPIVFDDTDPTTAAIKYDLITDLDTLGPSEITQDAFFRAIEQTWLRHNITPTFQNALHNLENGLFGVFKGMVCHLNTLFAGPPVAGVYPISSSINGRKLEDHSQKQPFVTVPKSTKPLIFTEVLLGDPFWTASNQVSDLGGCQSDFTAMHIGGNAILFTDRIRGIARNYWPFASLLSRQPAIAPTLLADRLFGGVPYSSPNWEYTTNLLLYQWLVRRFIAAGTVNCVEEANFISDCTADLRKRFIYHEIAGHFRDQLLLNLDHVPLGFAGLSEARACLSQLAFSDGPLYGLMELAIFSGGTSSQHAQYTQLVCTRLASELKLQYSTVGSAQEIVLECAELLATASGESVVREAALRLLDDPAFDIAQLSSST